MKLSARDRRALMTLIVAVVLFLTIDFGVLPAVDRLQEARRGLQVEELTLRKYRRAAASEAARQNGLADLEKRVTTVEAGLLESESSALAVAELQGIVKQIVAANQIDLAATEFLPPKPLDSRHTLISMRFGVTTTAERMVTLLAAFETAPKALAVRTLTINAVPNTPDKRLNVVLVLSGVMRAEKVEEKKKG